MKICISATQTETEVTFSVTDNGIGIDPHFQEKIFGLFKRLHTQDEYPGMGIGLALCQRIIESHGGRLWREPGKEVGSTICFSLKQVNSGVVEESFESITRGR